MDTAIVNPTNSLIDRSKGLSACGGAGASRAIRPHGLTSRDIEAEVLARLARRKYDWADAPADRRTCLHRTAAMRQEFTHAPRGVPCE